MPLLSEKMFVIRSGVLSTCHALATHSRSSTNSFQLKHVSYSSTCT